MSVSDPMILSWCLKDGDPNPNDPCFPCKPKPTAYPYVPTVCGWYCVIDEYPPGAIAGQDASIATSYVGAAGSIYGGDVAFPGPGVFYPVYRVIERNVAYDSNPYYRGYLIANVTSGVDPVTGEFQTGWQNAVNAASQTLANVICP